MFLYGESREVMFHVAGLLPFTPAPDAKPDHLRDLMDELRAGITVQRPWNQRLKNPDSLRTSLQSWTEDDAVDIDYHVRRTALPSPGDERELGVLVSRLHGYPIDFHRPPWEAHLIEGLEGGRFALYVKVHHSLVDGFTAMRLLANALSHGPDDRERPLFFQVTPRPRPPHVPPMAPLVADQLVEPATAYAELMGAVRAQFGTSKTVARALLEVARSARGTRDLVSPRRAPKCVLNTRIGRSRRFATQVVSTTRLRAVAKTAGGTLNDAILAVAASSLRRYLAELGALPTEPLIAMLPVAIRTSDDVGGGNAVGAILASLATDVADPAARLAAIVASTKHAKQQLQGMSKAAILQYSALLLAPSMFQMLPQVSGRMRPTFNIVISNVPGPEEPLYFRGARLEANYPMSIPVHGQALNITCSSYAGQVCFGFTGCRDTVPRLQRLAVYCGEALAELEHAIGPSA